MSSNRVTYIIIFGGTKFTIYLQKTIGAGPKAGVGRLLPTLRRIDSGWGWLAGHEPRTVGEPNKAGGLREELHGPCPNTGLL